MKPKRINIGKYVFGAITLGLFSCMSLGVGRSSVIGETLSLKLIHDEMLSFRVELANHSDDSIRIPSSLAIAPCDGEYFNACYDLVKMPSGQSGDGITIHSVVDTQLPLFYWIEGQDTELLLGGESKAYGFTISPMYGNLEQGCYQLKVNFKNLADFHISDTIHISKFELKRI